MTSVVERRPRLPTRLYPGARPGRPSEQTLNTAGFFTSISSGLGGPRWENKALSAEAVGRQLRRRWLVRWEGSIQGKMAFYLFIFSSFSRNIFVIFLIDWLIKEKKKPTSHSQSRSPLIMTPPSGGITTARSLVFIFPELKLFFLNIYSLK